MLVIMKGYVANSCTKSTVLSSLLYNMCTCTGLHSGASTSSSNCPSLNLATVLPHSGSSRLQMWPQHAAGVAVAGSRGGPDLRVSSTFVREALGEDFCRIFTAVKRAEHASFADHITDLEHQIFL